MLSRIARQYMLPYQIALRQDHNPLRAAIWSRQSGKDYTHMDEAVTLALLKARTTCLVTAPGERQALESLDKAKMWAEAYKVEIENEIEERDGGPQALIQSKTIVFPNKSRVIAIPGLPHLARGYSQAHLFATECDHFEDFAGFFGAIAPAAANEMRGERLIRIYSTPMSKSGFLYQVLDKNVLNPEPGKKLWWSVHQLNVMQAIEQGLKINLEKARATMPDAEMFQREYMCEWLDGSNVLLPYDLINGAQHSDCTMDLSNDFWRLPNQYPTFCGIDFGRTNDPTVCWTVQRIGGILWTKEVLVLDNKATKGGMPMPEQWELLKPRIKLANKTCLDYTGMGTYIGDDAVRLFGEHAPDGHKFGKVERFTFSPQSKRELFPNLRKVFESPVTIRIPEEVAIREDLHAMNQTVKNGQYSYDAKHSKEGHSDRCTALALAVRAAGMGNGMNFTPVPVARTSQFGSAVAERRNRSLIG
jgi:phage FluMu gp28-like protein